MIAASHHQVSRLGWFWALALYLVLAVATTVPGLASIGLLKGEGMVADMSTAMLDSGDYVVPRLYGKIYTYKPPLVYWLTAASMSVAGRDEWGLRLPAALAAIAMGGVVLLLVGLRTRPGLGLWAGVASITNMMIFEKTKLAEFDSVLACAVGVAVAAACFNLARGRRRESLAGWLLCYLALAAGFLAKGLPSLMAFGPGLLVAGLATGRLRDLVGWRHLVGGALFALLVGCYLWPLWQAAGPAGFAQPLAEAQQRGFEWTLASGTRTLAKPVLIAVGFLPWSLLWFWSWRAAVRPADSEPTPSADLCRASLGFVAAGALVFMAVPTLEPRYFLPLSVPAGIAAALGLASGGETSRRAYRLALSLATLCALLLVAAAAASLPPGTRAASAGVGLAALLAVWLPALRHSRRRVAMTLLVVALCGWTAETVVLRSERGRVRDLRPLAAEFDRLMPKGETVWVYGTPGEVGKHSALYFYLDRPVRAFLDAGDGPRSGAHLILLQAGARALELSAPDVSRRLELVRAAGYRGKTFSLYRLRELGAEQRDEQPAVPDRPATPVLASVP